MRKQLKNTTELVKYILEHDVRARNSDSFLYLKVIRIMAERKGHAEPKYISVDDFLLNMKEWGYPPFESVRRSRQKIQKQYPELRACKKVEEARAENELEYRAYAREVI